MSNGKAKTKKNNIETTQESVKVIQVRLGTRAPGKLKRWAQNQNDEVNDNARLALEFFVDIFGEGNVKSSSVLEKLALYKRIAEGQEVSLPIVQEEVHLKREEPQIKTETPIVSEKSREQEEILEEKEEEVQRDKINF